MSLLYSSVPCRKFYENVPYISLSDRDSVTCIFILMKKTRIQQTEIRSSRGGILRSAFVEIHVNYLQNLVKYFIVIILEIKTLNRKLDSIG